MALDRVRRSAKDVISNYANELLNRTNDKDVQHKLNTIEVIAMRMSWNDLYNRLRYRKHQTSATDQRPPWWTED